MKKQTGLTLIELMVTTIILVIMASVAVPSMKSFLDRGNFSVIGPIFEKSVKLARTEAIQSSQTVRISPSSGSNDWSQGWSISLVTGPNPTDLQLIRTFDEMPGDAIFTSDTFDGNTVLDILPTGQAAIIGNFSLNKAGCVGDIYTYNLLLSGIINRSVNPCP
jgi:type IV fimbrial biogenesis protein FimT